MSDDQQCRTNDNVGHAIAALQEAIQKERELREAYKVLMDERDRRYEERFKAQEAAVAAALASQERMTTNAFASSEKAIQKAETSQTIYNERSNEFRGQLADQAKTLIPRTEAEQHFQAYDEKLDDVKRAVADLRESRSRGSGKDQAAGESSVHGMWEKGNIIVTGVALIGMIVTIVLALMSKK